MGYSPWHRKDASSIPGSGRSPGEVNSNCSTILAWKIPWTEEPEGLQSLGWQSLTRLSKHTATTVVLYHTEQFHSPKSLLCDTYPAPTNPFQPLIFSLPPQTCLYQKSNSWNHIVQSFLRVNSFISNTYLRFLYVFFLN